MEADGIKSKATVSKEMWENHLVKKLQKGMQLTIWNKRAQLSFNGRNKTSCLLGAAKKVIGEDLVEKIGRSPDGEGIVYKIKDEYLKTPIEKKELKIEEDEIEAPEDLDSETISTILDDQGDIEEIDDSVDDGD